MARVVKEKEYNAKKNDILDVAQRLSLTKGYEQMSIQDILDELRISKGAFYHYFDSKQALAEALITRMGEETVDNTRSIVDDSNLNAIQKLQNIFTMINGLRVGRKTEIVKLLRIWYTDDNAFIRQKVEEAALEQRIPFFNEIVRQGIQEEIFTISYSKYIGEIILYLLKAMGTTHARLLLSLDKGNSKHHCVEDIIATYMGYMDAIERVLGLPSNSLFRVDEKAVEPWVDAFAPASGKQI